MKKLSVIALAGAMSVLLLTACSSGKESSSENQTDDISYAKMIPDNSIFENGEFNIIDQDGGEMYCFSVSNYTDDEYSEYVSQCKEMGFTDISYEYEAYFGSYSTDGEYWVQLSKESDGTLTIICNKSKNK
ncbi:MAG: hypothetical protein LIO41_04195 [Ruminococcus sp.]|nr:hypothetical protein [Ruminococcus sp.]